MNNSLNHNRFYFYFRYHILVLNGFPKLKKYLVNYIMKKIERKYKVYKEFDKIRIRHSIDCFVKGIFEELNENENEKEEIDLHTLNYLVDRIKSYIKRKGNMGLSDSDIRKMVMNEVLNNSTKLSDWTWVWRNKNRIDSKRYKIVYSPN